MTEHADNWVEVELITVDNQGNRTVRQLKDLTESFAINKAAERILLDIFETAKEEVLKELPGRKVKANIWSTKDGNHYKVEVKGKNFTRVYHLAKDKTVYYYGGVDVKGFYVYIRVEAVYSPAMKTTFYNVIVDNNTVKATAEELNKMLKNEE
jgi:stress-induced morphogen